MKVEVIDPDDKRIIDRVRVEGVRTPDEARRRLTAEGWDPRLVVRDEATGQYSTNSWHMRLKEDDNV